MDSESERTTSSILCPFDRRSTYLPPGKCTTYNIFIFRPRCNCNLPILMQIQGLFLSAKFVFPKFSL